MLAPEKPHVLTKKDLIAQITERYGDRVWARKVGTVMWELLPDADKSVKIALALAKWEPFRKDRVADAVMDLLLMAYGISIDREKAKEAVRPSRDRGKEARQNGKQKQA